MKIVYISNQIKMLENNLLKITFASALPNALHFGTKIKEMVIEKQ